MQLSGRVSKRRVSDDDPRVNGKTSVAAPFALTAASTPVTATGPAGAPGGSGNGRNDGGWASQAWNYYDQVAELRYVCAWLSNALSRCALVPSDVDPDTGQPTGETDDVMTQSAVRDIAGGPAGQAALLGRLATFLTVPGDLYVAIIYRSGTAAQNTLPGTQSEEWYVLSTDEVKKSSSKIELLLPDGTKHEFNESSDTLSRVHRPHPRNAKEADSPVRACLPILREIVRLGQHVESTAKSRLAGNGILVLPNQLSMPVQQAPAAEPLPAAADPDLTTSLPAPAGVAPAVAETAEASPALVNRSVTAADVMTALMQAAGAAMEDPGAAVGQIPIMLQADGEYIDKIKHLKMGTEFTEVVMKLREAATKRLAIGLDVPPEVLLGTGNMNHWSAWQMEESAIKLHVEPLLTIAVDALTVDILHPLLRLLGHPDPESKCIWFDTTGLSQRPNRAQDAKDAYDRGGMSPVAMLEYLGFSEADALDLTDPAQLQAFVVNLVMKNGALLSDPVIASVLGLSGVLPAPATPAPGEVPDAEDTTPIPAEPEPEEEVPAAARAVAVLANSALERALHLGGNRLRTRGNLSDVMDVPRHNTHTRVPVGDRSPYTLCRGWQDGFPEESLAEAGVGASRVTAFYDLVGSKVDYAMRNRLSLKQCRFRPAEVESLL